MKKLTAFFASFALILCLCFSAVACNKQDPSNIAGTYKLSGITTVIDGTTITMAPGSKFMDVSLTEESVVLYLRDNYTFKLIDSTTGTDVYTIGSWEYNGNASAAVILTAKHGDVSGKEETDVFNAVIDEGVFSMARTSLAEKESESDSSAPTEILTTTNLKKVSSEADTDSSAETSIDAVAGTYKLSQMVIAINGVTTTIKAGESFMGLEISEDSAVLVLNADKTYKLTSAAIGTEEEAEEDSGVWDFGRTTDSIVLFAPDNATDEEGAKQQVVAINKNTITISEVAEGISITISLNKSAANAQESASESEAQGN